MRFLSYTRLIGLLGILLLPAACNLLPAGEVPGLTYAHVDKVMLSVKNVRVDHVYQPSPEDLPVGYAHVEQFAPTVPSVAIENWAQEKLVAAGGLYNARVGILEASIIKRPLPVDKSFTGWFKSEEEFRYDINLNVVVEILDARGFVAASANSVIGRSQTTLEDMTLAEQDQILFDLTEQAMNDLDEELTLAMYEYLQLFILNKDAFKFPEKEDANPSQNSESF